MRGSASFTEREIFVGSLTSADVASRDVLRFALQDHASSVIVFHNHPSGDYATTDRQRPASVERSSTYRLADPPVIASNA
jgi:DNA repair protein RadC